MKDIINKLKKKFVENFDIDLLGKDALEALVFVLIGQLKVVVNAIGISALDDLMDKLEAEADKISPTISRAAKEAEAEEEAEVV